MRDIASELAVLLEGAGLGLVRPPSLGANLFSAPMPEADGDVSDWAVALIVTGGAEPQAYLGLRRAAYLAPHCQVRVRSAREDFEGGQRLTQAVFASLSQAVLSPYAVVRADDSMPTYVGPDGTGCHKWVMNFVVRCLSWD
ncbi:hypothetical protein ACIHQR_23090 [Corallococcus coralloides]|uniref:hypothetical protein n=1 Tax=Corallococcus coralloides TaxID=184914 RepID=UPI00384C3AB5